MPSISAAIPCGSTVWPRSAVASRSAPLCCSLGRPRVAAVGPWHLTFTAAEGVWRRRARSARATIGPRALRGLGALLRVAAGRSTARSPPPGSAPACAGCRGGGGGGAQLGRARRHVEGDRWRARTDRVAAPTACSTVNPARAYLVGESRRRPPVQLHVDRQPLVVGETFEALPRRGPRRAARRPRAAPAAAPPARRRDRPRRSASRTPARRTHAPAVTAARACRLPRTPARDR
jgi:hypothetical protein